MTTIITILAIALILGLLIAVHELGHFAAAKLSGIDVEEFAIGFGKNIFSREYLGTHYKLNLIPLGGYVKLAGEDRTESDADPKHFHNKPLHIKIFVLLAGVFMNMLMAILLLGIYLPMTNYKVELAKIVDYNFIGTESTKSFFPLTINEVSADSAAKAAGLAENDFLVGVAEVNFGSVDEFKALLKDNAGKETTLQILDPVANEVKTINVTLPDKADNILGVTISAPRFPYYQIVYPKNFLSAINHTINITLYQFPALGKLISTSVEKSDASLAAGSVNGVIGVSAFVNDIVAAEQFILLLNLTALISISLAIVNVLPLPILDGGQVVISIIEAIRGRKISNELLGKINFVSFVFIIVLSIVISLKDLWQYDVIGQFLNNLRKVLGL